MVTEDQTKLFDEAVEPEEEIEGAVDLDSAVLGLNYSVPDFMRDVICKYAPGRRPIKLLDPMVSNGAFYKRLIGYPEGNSISFLLSDERKTKVTQRIGDVFDMQEVWADHLPVDMLVIDPPYDISYAGAGTDKRAGRYGIGAIMGYGETERLFNFLNEQCARILAPDGTVIVNVQDRHKDGKFIPYHILIAGWLTNLELFDILIYRYFYYRKSWKSNYAHNSHSYYLIFKLRKDGSLV
mgnify:FL=1